VAEFVDEQVKHVLVGTKGDTPLCLLTLQFIVPELIVREMSSGTCPRCKAVMHAFERLFARAPQSL